MSENHGKYLLVVTGSIPLAEDGIYTTIGGQHREEHPGGGGRRRRRGDRGRRLRALGQRPGGAPESDRRRRRLARGARQAGGQHRRVSADRGRHHGDDRPLPDLPAHPGAGWGRAAALRLRQAHPRPVPAARALRRGSVRRGLRRRGRAPGLVPVQGRLQGTGDLLALPDHPVEQRDELADRRGASVHRLHGAQLLGHDVAVLPPDAGSARLRRRAHRRRDRPVAGRRAPPPASRRTQSAPPCDTRAAVPRKRPRAGRTRGRSMATTKVVVDPITRIEGHLRIEVQAEDGRIAYAWATSTQFRGIELVMQGRDPRDAWAFAQRICGVCTVVHAVASCRAVEDALGIRVPPNANTIRNLVHGMQTVQDHVIHFYHLHALDWVDVVSALSADPAETAQIARSISPWPNNSASLVRRGAGAHPQVRAERPARHLHERLLGTPGLQAAAGGEPAGGGALPRGPRLAARRDPPAHDLRRQEPAPELPGGRHGVGDQPGRHGHDQRGAPDRDPGDDPARPPLRGRGLLAGPAGHRGLLQGLGGDRRRRRQLPGRRRVPGRRLAREGDGLLPRRHRDGAQPHRGAALRPHQGQGVHRQLLVRVPGRQRRRAAPVGGRDDAEVHGAADAVDLSPGACPSTPG